MEELKNHWTAQSTDDFLYRIAADFVQQIENFLDAGPENQTTLAEKLKVSPARVSQVLNNPGNMTLRVLVEYARALGKKLAVVAYDDDDSDNVNGPINSQVFELCWKRAGRPRDFMDIEDADSFHHFVILPLSGGIPTVLPLNVANVSAATYGVEDSAGTDANRVRIEKPVGATTHG